MTEKQAARRKREVTTVDDSRPLPARFYTPAEVAARIGVTRRTVYRWMKERNIGYWETKTGLKRISCDDLELFSRWREAGRPEKFR